MLLTEIQTIYKGILLSIAVAFKPRHWGSEQWAVVQFRMWNDEFGMKDEG